MQEEINNVGSTNEEQNIPATPTLPPLENTFKYFPFPNQILPIIVLALVGIIFYCTSLYNETALDDGIIIHQNDYVLQGASGIKKIMTSDAYASFYARMNAKDQLAGGRYRPLSIVSYAIEQEMIGKYPNGAYSNGCWDKNKNGINERAEDLNKDGVYNEVDCQIQGSFLRHFDNMWTYILGCILLYLVLRNHMFRDDQDLAFLSALIFLAHPVHSEVVANIRGRQDIFSLIFISLTLLYAFKFIDTKKISSLIIATIMFLLALLSKEYAAMLLMLIPLAFYVFKKIDIEFKTLVPMTFVFLLFLFGILYLRSKDDFTPALSQLYPRPFPFIYSGLIICAAYIIFVIVLFRKSIQQKNLNSLMICFYGAFLFYVTLRFNAVLLWPGVPDTEILNNPYLLATGEEIFSTKIYVLLKYLCLAIFPKDLTVGYSYASIAYRHFASGDFILSVVLHLGLLYYGIKLVIKRHVLGFAIITYFAFLLLVSNLFFNLGGVMIERWMFHASIGFSIAAAWLALKGFDKISSLTFNAKRTIMLSSLTLVLFLYGCKTWERNFDWKNDITLFMKDVTTAPNDVLCLGNAGARWIDLSDVEYFTGMKNDSTDLPFSTYSDKMLEFKVSDEELKNGLTKDNIILPVEGEFRNEQKFTLHERALYKGIGYLKHAVSLHPRYVNGYLNLGLAYYKLNRERESIYYWKLAEHLYPNNPYLKNYYIVYYNQLSSRGYQKLKEGETDKAIDAFNKMVTLDKYNPEGWYDLGGAYYTKGNHEKAKSCWNEVLKLNPDHEEALKALRQLDGNEPINILLEKKENKPTNKEKKDKC